MSVMKREREKIALFQILVLVAKIPPYRDARPHLQLGHVDREALPGRDQFADGPHCCPN